MGDIWEIYLGMEVEYILELWEIFGDIFRYGGGIYSGIMGDILEYI